ncbi:serum amyloid P-component-like [Centropristis striata]|uniref:serum amyloid P-component-like n=1 Tax=Centropristis striata TaxID=184440 RepID=UPI0027DF7866|nr:serum amyloid P-component-like [Centropristis striata]
MAFFLLLVMLATCAAVPENLSDKMLTFPQKTKTANVRLTTLIKDFSAVTVCLRFITDLDRAHSLFSLSTRHHHNAFLIFWTASKDECAVYVGNTFATFGIKDYKPNEWHSICSTWDAASGLVQLWLDGKPSTRKYVGGPRITYPIVILGQEQDSYGGSFHIDQSFVGMLSDVHMWNHVLSPCEIQRYMDDLNFRPGNALNWGALECRVTGRVLNEDKQVPCFLSSH